MAASLVSRGVGGATHLHNVPVVLSGGGEGDFLALLQSKVRPRDFVSLKVDIDGGPELEIMRAIADSPKLARLVDEVYFECHFRGFPVDFGWGPYLGESSPTAKDCLELMRKLRHGGVRSHFWV